MSTRSARRFFAETGHRCAYCGRDLLESLETFLGRQVSRLDASTKPRVSLPCCTPCMVLLRRTSPRSLEEGRELIARHRAEAERNFAWLQVHGRDGNTVAGADAAIEEGPDHE